MSYLSLIMFTATDKPAIYYWLNVSSTLIFQPAGDTSTLLASNAGVTYPSLQAKEAKGQLHKHSHYIKTVLLTI